MMYDVTTRPAACTAGAMRAVGAGGVGKIVKVSAFDVPPPPPSVSVKTVTGTDAALATSLARMAAFNPVGPEKTVERGLPFQFTTEHGRKPLFAAVLPVTPSVSAPDPTKTLAGESCVITGVASGVVDAAIVNGDAAEASDGTVVLDTVIDTGPAKAVS